VSEYLQEYKKEGDLGEKRYEGRKGGGKVWESDPEGVSDWAGVQLIWSRRKRSNERKRSMGKREGTGIRSRRLRKLIIHAGDKLLERRRKYNLIIE